LTDDPRVAELIAAGNRLARLLAAPIAPFPVRDALSRWDEARDAYEDVDP